jgi:hypothetical protein
MGGACVGTVSCGAGTTRVGDTCTANPSNLSCGPGTTLAGSQCVSALSCGSGTTQSGSACVSSLSCGTGTAQVSNACVVNLSSVCSTDTTGAGGNRCVSSLSCGSGTTRSGNQCTASSAPPVTCGPGTVLQGTTCVVPSPSGPLSTFLGLSTNARAARHPPSSGAFPNSWSFIVTSLSQGNADAWVNIGAPMIGTGRALHIEDKSYSSLGSTPIYSSVEDSTVAGPGGTRACRMGLTPDALTTGILVNLFDWAGGTATPAVCGRQGTVKMERAFDSSLGLTRTRLTLNVVFSDGTTLTDHVIWF